MVVLCIICYYGFRSIAKVLLVLAKAIDECRNQIDESLSDKIAEGILSADREREKQQESDDEMRLLNESWLGKANHEVVRIKYRVVGRW